MSAEIVSNIATRIKLKSVVFNAWVGIKSIEPKKLIASSLPFLCYLILFSFNKGISHLTGLDKIVKPNYLLLNKIERTLFFCNPHRVLSYYTNPLFDLCAAVPYLIHFPLPVLYGLYLLITPKKRLFIYQYFWLAGWVNLLAVLFQISYPTAPPWFVDSAVFDEYDNVIYTSPVEGGFNRLDKILGISLFHGLYSQSPLPFGAFPSLHCAWPAVILWSHPWGGWKVGVFHVLWISLSAMYITHHYLVDVLGGILLSSFVRLCITKIGSPFPELVDNKKRCGFICKKMIDFRAALIFSICMIATYFIIKRNKLHSKLLFHIGYVLYSKTRLGYYYHKRIVGKSKGYHSNLKALTIDGFTIHVIPILLDNYSYLIVDNLSNQGVVVDPADGYTVQRFVTDNKVNLKAILTTHKHWDHAGGNAVLKDLYPDLLIYGSREDSPLLVNRYINERTSIKIGQLEFQARLTPGHTIGNDVIKLIKPGHVVYMLTSTTKQHCLFSGDHLFSGGCGRVFEGTYEQMFKSLQIIMTMEQSTLIFPGHEYTYKNVKFALLLEPTNKNIERKVDEIRLLRITREPTVPSILRDELQYNPFLRTSLLRDLENFKTENEIGVLQKLREFKDTVNHTL